MKKMQQVEIDISPEEMAHIWWQEWGNEEQVRFFNHIAKVVHEEWSGGNDTYKFLLQLQYVTDTKELTDRARWIMKMIGEYADKTKEHE